MVPGVLRQEPVGQRGALREPEDGVEGSFFINDVVEEVVGFAQRAIVCWIEGSWPVVVAVVGGFVRVADPWAGCGRFELTVDKVEGGCVVTFEFSYQRSCIEASIVKI